MRTLFQVLALSIVVASLSVNRASASDTISQPLTDLYSRVISSGTPASLDNGRASFLQIKAGTAERVEEVYGDEDASDGLDHGCEVILNDKGEEVTNLVLRVTTMTDANHSESYYFKLSPSGYLERAVVGRAVYRNNKPVRGSGRVNVIGTSSQALKARLQHELDFWLKGMYRKKKSPAR